MKAPENANFDLKSGNFVLFIKGWMWYNINHKIELISYFCLHGMNDWFKLNVKLKCLFDSFVWGTVKGNWSMEVDNDE